MQPNADQHPIRSQDYLTFINYGEQTLFEHIYLLTLELPRHGIEEVKGKVYG